MIASPAFYHWANALHISRNDLYRENAVAIERALDHDRNHPDIVIKAYKEVYFWIAIGG